VADDDAKVRPFPQSGRPAIDIDPERGTVRVSGIDMAAEMADIAATAKASIDFVEPPQLVPDEDLRLVVRTLMELLQARRELLDAYGRGLRERYEVFACVLRESGFRFYETDDRKARAKDQRRLGELAEASGNIAAAIVFYEWALASWPEIGCRRRLAALRRRERMDHVTRSDIAPTSGITVGELRRQLAAFADDAELYLGGLHYFRLKQRGPNVVQLEFNEQVYRTAEGELVVEDVG
jgi:hypothetical protein